MVLSSGHDPRGEIDRDLVDAVDLERRRPRPRPLDGWLEPGIETNAKTGLIGRHVERPPGPTVGAESKPMASAPGR